MKRPDEQQRLQSEETLLTHWYKVVSPRLQTEGHWLGRRGKGRGHNTPTHPHAHTQTNKRTHTPSRKERAQNLNNRPRPLPPGHTDGDRFRRRRRRCPPADWLDEEKPLPLFRWRAAGRSWRWRALLALWPSNPGRRREKKEKKKKKKYKTCFTLILLTEPFAEP